MNRNRVAVALLGMIAAVTLIAVATNGLIRRSNGAIRIHPPPPWAPSRPVAADAARDSQPRLRLDAPHERADIDSGVTNAARTFAIQLVTENLKVPDSARYPEDSIAFERLNLLNQTTGGRIEHWFVAGAVDSNNDYGVKVRSRWRVLLAREADEFFPVMAQLGDFEIYRMRGYVELLAEGRRVAWQERQAQAAAQKADELAANRALWQAIDAAKPAEEKARAALKLARDLWAAGREAPARRRLQELIEKYPGTQAARQAEEMLAGEAN